MKRMRTIQQAAEEIKATDPNTAIKEYAIRQLVISGVCPSFKVGRKYLLDLSALEAILSGEIVSEPKVEEADRFLQNSVRRIGKGESS